MVRSLLLFRHLSVVPGRMIHLSSVSSDSSEFLASSSSSMLIKPPPTREEIFARYPPTEGSVTREAWLETLESTKAMQTGEVVPLHPDIWSVRPRVDCIKKNIDWQTWYRRISFVHYKNRYELPERSRRPWPLKGTGRARHASIRSPLWIHGGRAHGPRSPRSYFYMLNFNERLNGLVHTLAVKMAQDDVHIVKDLNIPSQEPKFIEDLIDEKRWALSTLFVDVNDIMPENITAATDPILHVNLMPAYGLNVFSMLKHKTLVLTLDALNHIEDKLLKATRRLDKAEVCVKSKEKHHDTKIL